MLSNKVLLATDFSNPAEKLTDSLDELEALDIDEVILTHVINVNASKIMHIDQFKKAKIEKLEQLQAIIQNKGFKVQLETLMGKPAEEIAKLAQAENVAFILIASRGKGFVETINLGSTTYDLIQKSTQPVLIEKFENIVEGNIELARTQKFKRLLLPLDFSDCSQKTINFVNQLTKTLKEITLLTIIENSDISTNLDEATENLQEKLQDIKTDLDNKKIADNIFIKIKKGKASEKIIETAQEEEFDLIALSTRGRGELEEMPLGSTADRVAKESPVPILLLPCQKK